MATLLDFRRRIRSVKNTQQITRAMKFVSAARLRRAQESALAARPYAKELLRVLRSTMARIESPQHPLLAKRPEERILVMVLAGERGLAGAFNSNILRKAAEFCRSKPGKKFVDDPVGKKEPRCVAESGFRVRRRICERAGACGLRRGARDLETGHGACTARTRLTLCILCSANFTT